MWLMKRRAGQVGERLGREWLAPAFTVLGDRAPRVHLIGHSFGAKLVTSAVLGGVRPDTLVLLQAAFSAFAFAEDVPGTKRPGFYRPVIAARMVAATRSRSSGWTSWWLLTASGAKAPGSKPWMR